MPEEALTSTTSQPSAHGLGATLHGLRQAKSLSLEAVSARLKFSVRQIEALEAEHWQGLPKGLPLRGMVKNYARLLEADPDALLTMLDASTTQASLPRQSLASGPAANAVGPMTEDAPRRGSWGWLFIVLVLVLIAFFYALDRGWLPESWQFANWFNNGSGS